MKQYAGLDVSLKEISICVVDVDGAVLVRGTVLTEPEAVASFLAKQQITPERIVHGRCCTNTGSSGNRVLHL